MKSERLLILKFTLVTVAAVVVVCLATTSLTWNKNNSMQAAVMVSYDSLTYGKDVPQWRHNLPPEKNTADFINQNFPFHIVSPEWMLAGNQSRMIRDWLKVEKQVRLGVIFIICSGLSGLMFMRHCRNQKKP